MATKNRFQDSFSAGKIGTGKFYTAGSFSSRARRGLAGALRQAKAVGRHSFAKNLSRKDLETFQGLLGEEMSKLSTHSRGLSRKARARIMSQAETLRKQGKISAADKQDLRQIVKALGPNANKQGVGSDVDTTVKGPRERATHFASSDDMAQEKLASTPTQAAKHIKANIAIDNAREILAEERGEKSIKHDPRSALGQLEQQDNTDESQAKPKGQPSSRGKKIELPSTENLPDMDIG